MSIKRERSVGVMILYNSSCDQGRFPVNLNYFNNDEFGITRVRVRYRVNFRSQKLRSSYKNHNDDLSLGCHPRDNSHVTLRSKLLCLSIYTVKFYFKKRA